MLAWMPVWNPPPKSTGSLSGCWWAQAVWMRSREVMIRKSEARNPKSKGNPKSEIRRRAHGRRNGAQALGCKIPEQGAGAGACRRDRAELYCCSLKAALLCSPRTATCLADRGALRTSDFGLRASCLVHQLLLNLFQRLAFGFGQPCQDARKPDAADAGVNPESDGRAEDGVEDGEGIGEQKTGDPQKADRDGHGGAAYPVREDLRDDYPRDRRQGHRIRRDGRQHQHEEQGIWHEAAPALEMVAIADSGVDQCQASRAEQHQRLASQAVHREQGDEGEEEVHQPCHDDVG